MTAPAMVVMRAESRPREEKREIRKETIRPTMPGGDFGWIVNKVCYVRETRVKMKTKQMPILCRYNAHEQIISLSTHQ